MDKIRLAIVTRRYPPLIGGAERVLAYLAEALAAQGAAVSVLTSALDGRPGVETTGGGGVVEVVRLATSRLRFVGTWMYMNGLRRWFDRRPIDLAYVSMLKHDAFVTVDAGRRRGFPVVLRPEGAGATGDVAWQAWGRGGRAIARRCKAADAFVSISDAVRGELVAAGYDSRRIVDLPNGVPVPELAWTPRSSWHDAPRAVFVGRLAAEKGLDALVDAWPIVLAAFPTATLRLVGDGPERAGLEAKVRRLGLGACVLLPGASSDPGAILREADLFVLPSREEGMSIALLEAMAMGIPLAASDVPGNRRLVVDGETGRLAPPDDPAAIAAAVVAQWSDPGRAAAMATRARELVGDRYSIAAVARAHLVMFTRLIADHEARG